MRHPVRANFSATYIEQPLERFATFKNLHAPFTVVTSRTPTLITINISQKFLENLNTMTAAAYHSKYRHALKNSRMYNGNDKASKVVPPPSRRPQILYFFLQEKHLSFSIGSRTSFFQNGEDFVLGYFIILSVDQPAGVNSFRDLKKTLETFHIYVTASDSIKIIFSARMASDSLYMCVSNHSLSEFLHKSQTIYESLQSCVAAVCIHFKIYVYIYIYIYI